MLRVTVFSLFLLTQQCLGELYPVDKFPIKAGEVDLKEEDVALQTETSGLSEKCPARQSVAVNLKGLKKLVPSGANPYYTNFFQFQVDGIAVFRNGWEATMDCYASRDETSCLKDQCIGDQEDNCRQCAWCKIGDQHKELHGQFGTGTCLQRLQNAYCEILPYAVFPYLEAYSKCYKSKKADGTEVELYIPKSWEQAVCLQHKDNRRACENEKGAYENGVVYDCQYCELPAAQYQTMRSICLPGYAVDNYACKVLQDLKDVTTASPAPAGSTSSTASTVSTSATTMESTKPNSALRASLVPSTLLSGLLSAVLFTSSL